MAATQPLRQASKQIDQIDTQVSLGGKAHEGGGAMVHVFLYGATNTVMDFIVLGRHSGAQAVARGMPPAKNKIGCIIGRFDSAEEPTAALMRQMDEITDAKIVRQAEVYRMTLVGCE
ncbi:hypothetical protein AYO21_00018 [Fonsecaea monophora]|uniref:Uncharacterized protein n=1 Tax=Fonsecaea monophora TaxID=254056 RepID=A0A177FM26_9EURO|nr:hypothetical protein AYO21_00018 [Fonsecaea monophora]OAG45384.1 hypothetical protein AYO21_00018 [Fonsecaea monophora]